MRIPIRLRLLLWLGTTGSLMLLVVVLTFFSQQQIDDGQAAVQVQQQQYDMLRRSQVLVLRIADAAPDNAARPNIDHWRSELDALMAPSTAANQGADDPSAAYSEQYAAFGPVLDKVLAAAQGGDANGAASLRASELAPIVRTLVDQQDTLIAASLLTLDNARDSANAVLTRAKNIRLIGGIVALLLVIFSGWTTISWTGRPIAELARQVRRAAAAPSENWPDFHVEPGAPREVGDLTAGFNQLATQLRQNNIDLEQANLKLESLNQEVLAASRAKSAFLATMSHELRTPLNAIIGFSEMLVGEMYGPLNQKQHTQLERMLRNSQNLLTLINDVLDISRVEAGKLPLQISAFNPEGVIASVVNTVEPLARQKGLAVTVDLMRPMPEIVTDESRLRQILLNLASNAIKFTRQGSINIGTYIDPSLPTWLVFTVEDTGIGIPEGDLAHVWDEFYQVQNGLTREAGGSGLGLAIVRKLVDVLGGDIEVQSAPGEGTRFTVYIPLIPSTVSDGAAGASLYAATGSFVRNAARRPSTSNMAG